MFLIMNTLKLKQLKQQVESDRKRKWYTRCSVCKGVLPAHYTTICAECRDKSIAELDAMDGTHKPGPSLQSDWDTVD